MDDANENTTAGNYRINKSKAARCRYFKYNAKIIGCMPANNNTLDLELVAPLKYLSNF